MREVLPEAMDAANARLLDLMSDEPAQAYQGEAAKSATMNQARPRPRAPSNGWCGYGPTHRYVAQCVKCKFKLTSFIQANNTPDCAHRVRFLNLEKKHVVEK